MFDFNTERRSAGSLSHTLMFEFDICFESRHYERNFENIWFNFAKFFY
jgi:hypothetical protein